VEAGDRIIVLDEASLAGTRIEEVEANAVGENETVRLTTASGISLVLALNTPITLSDGRHTVAANAWGHLVPVVDESGFRWELCCDVEYTGPRNVAHIRCRQATYAAGDAAGRCILTHNPTYKN
jgi:hypothetical protein